MIPQATRAAPAPARIQAIIVNPPAYASIWARSTSWALRASMICLPAGDYGRVWARIIASMAAALTSSECSAT